MIGFTLGRIVVIGIDSATTGSNCKILGFQKYVRKIVERRMKRNLCNEEVISENN